MHVARQVAEEGPHLGIGALAGHQVLDVAAIPGGATGQLDLLAGRARVWPLSEMRRF
jgi:hypothetical protein